MARQDPYKVLGLEKGADKQEVKQAFRRMAMKLHPDLNPGPTAAEEYSRVRTAADAILNKVEHKPEAAAYTQARNASWNPGAISRSPKFPIYFSFACLLGGCIIFAGALHSHIQLFDGYSYNIVQESERRRENPTPGQQRIIDLLIEKKEQGKFEEGR